MDSFGTSGWIPFTGSFRFSNRNWTFQDVDKLLGNRHSLAIKNRKETKLNREWDGSVTLSYHNSQIIRWKPDGTLVLDQCTDTSPMTLVRFEEFTPADISMFRYGQKSKTYHTKKLIWWDNELSKLLEEEPNQVVYHLPEAAFDTYKVSLDPKGGWSSPSLPFIPYGNYRNAAGTIELNASGQPILERYFLDAAPFFEHRSMAQPWDRPIPSDFLALENQETPKARLHLVRRSWRTNRPTFQIWKARSTWTAILAKEQPDVDPEWRERKSKDLDSLLRAFEGRFPSRLTVGNLFDFHDTPLRVWHTIPEKLEVPASKRLFHLEYPKLFLLGALRNEIRWTVQAEKRVKQYDSIRIRRIHWMVPIVHGSFPFKNVDQKNPPFPGFSAWPGPENGVVAWLDLANGHALGIQRDGRRLWLLDHAQAEPGPDTEADSLLAGLLVSLFAVL